MTRTASASTRRKHRVVVEVTFGEPCTAKQAVQQIQALLDVSHSSMREWQGQQISLNVKEGERVILAESLKYFRNRSLAAVNPDKPSGDRSPASISDIARISGATTTATINVLAALGELSFVDRDRMIRNAQYDREIRQAVAESLIEDVS